MFIRKLWNDKDFAEFALFKIVKITYVLLYREESCVNAIFSHFIKTKKLFNHYKVQYNSADKICMKEKNWWKFWKWQHCSCLK